MITSMMLWNEANHLPHPDFQRDPGRRHFGTMTRCAARTIKESAPHVKLVLGGISPIDPNFIELLISQRVMEDLDAADRHGHSRTNKDAVVRACP